VTSRPDAADQSGLSGTVMGLHVPGWLVLTSLVAGLATFALLINGPQPWRATRWAWAWFILNPFGLIGSLAFLLLSGPVPPVPAAKQGDRRLHGGWAFLIAAVAGGAWGQCPMAETRAGHVPTQRQDAPAAPGLDGRLRSQPRHPWAA
jgi:hypothetical protein